MAQKYEEKKTATGNKAKFVGRSLRNPVRDFSLSYLFLNIS